MLNQETILKIYNKDKQFFIDSYISEIKSRFQNFKKFNALEKYNEALELWENQIIKKEPPNNEEIILKIEETKHLTRIEPEEALKIKINEESIKKITSKFKSKKSQYWMTPDPTTFPKNPDQKVIATINVFWYLVGRPVNFDLTLYLESFKTTFEKSKEICAMEWDSHELYTEISHMSKRQFGDFLIKHKDSFAKILSPREINFNNRFNRD